MTHTFELGVSGASVLSLSVQAVVHIITHELNGEWIVSAIFDFPGHVKTESFIAPTRKEAWAAMCAWTARHLEEVEGVCP